MAVAPLMANSAGPPLNPMPRATDVQSQLKELENQLEKARDLAKLNQLSLNEAQDKLIQYAREARRAEELISFLLEQLDVRRH
jgi:hypothetical protein